MDNPLKNNENPGSICKIKEEFTNSDECDESEGTSIDKMEDDQSEQNDFDDTCTYALDEMMVSASHDGSIIEKYNDCFTEVKFVPKEIKKSKICMRTQAVHHYTTDRILRKFICNKCIYTTASRRSINIHAKLHIRNENKPFICQDCQYTAYNLHDLAFHKRHKHSHMKRFECNECGKRYIMKNNLKLHILVNHIRSNDFKCLLCDYACSCRQYIIFHIKKHHKGSVFSCLHCTSLFLSDRSLKEHMISAHREKFLVKCKLCDYACRKETTLERHISHNHMMNIVDHINSSMLSLT